MNPSERGINRPEEGLTRRHFLFGGLAATALFLANGCAEIDLPQRAEPREDGRPQTVPEPQIDEDAARNLSVLYMATIGAALFLLRNIR